MNAREKQKAAVIAGFWLVVTILNMAILPIRHAPRVNVERVKAMPMELIVRAPGNLEAKASVTLKAQFDGSVESKQFREGQKVTAGQLLAVINRDKIRIDYQQKQDMLINAKADLMQARREVRLQKTLYEKQAVAHSAVDEAKRNLVKSTQALRAAEEAYKLEQARWDSAKVVSPIAGTLVKDGLGDDKTTTGGKEIVTIADVSEFTVKARVDELDIKRVVENQPAEVRIQIYPQNVFKAHVMQIGSQPDAPESSAIPVVLAIEEAQNILLRPKLTADVWIIAGRTAPLFSVPLAAINNAEGTPRVWVLDGWNRLRARGVSLGQTNPDRVEVKEGLHEGERVCTPNESTLMEGMHIMIVPPKETH